MLLDANRSYFKSTVWQIKILNLNKNYFLLKLRINLLELKERKKKRGIYKVLLSLKLL